MSLKEIRQAGSCLMPQVMEVEPAQSRPFASSIESL
jgi:hypothetical protein